MDFKKLSPGTALAASIGMAYACPNKSPELPNNIESPAAKDSFLKEATAKYEKYVQERSDHGFRGPFEDAFRKLDELAATKGKGEVTRCEHPEEGKNCLMKLGGTKIWYEIARYHPYNTKPGTMEEYCRAFIYVGAANRVLINDRYCDGKTEDMVWIYDNVTYGGLEWQVEDQKDFFEKTLDPFWAKLTSGLSK